MSSDEPPLPGDSPVRNVAAFDFDGTISQRDTLAGFLVYVAGPTKFARAAASESASMGRGLRSSEQRNAAKERLLGRVLGGRSEEDVTDAGIRYASRLPQRFRPGTVAEITKHRDAGHDLVIVSASLVYYLRPLAEDLGFHHVIGVSMAVLPDGRLATTLEGPNVRKAEKARRLRAWLGEEPFELWAYGDSSGDEDLLAMADHPTWIGRRATRN